MIIAKDKQFLGVVTLYRNIGKDDFNHDEVFLVDTLKEHMAYRLGNKLLWLPRKVVKRG